ncbi:hypothetical protein SADUNF_Sadunf04G0046100 [Salix dunnii]|uniref:Uncharacterized protein n=1 Tax=Salix dunnii TaxID=1413687 RepID=A0A835KAL1_9ROSI|nr:hypothetical protein SADUNF_Sadunf04G0046100 [Salix dunnii]
MKILQNILKLMSLISQQATWMTGFNELSISWNFYCVEILFETGAFSNQTGIGCKCQICSSGALKCSIRDADQKLTEKR